MNRISIHSAGRRMTGTSHASAGLFAGRPLGTGMGWGVAARVIDGDRCVAGPVGMTAESMIHEGLIGAHHHHQAAKMTVVVTRADESDDKMAVIKPSGRPAAGRDPKG